MKTILKACFSLCAAFGAVTLFGATARAQADLLSGKKPFRLKIGGYFPTSGNTKSDFGKNLVAGGLSYRPLKLIPLDLYTDYTEASKNGNKLQIFDFGVSTRHSLLPISLPIGGPYIEGGLGYYNVKVGGGGTKSRIGGKVALGYESPIGIFGEAEYDIITKVNGYDPSGYRLNIGYRF